MIIASLVHIFLELEYLHQTVAIPTYEYCPTYFQIVNFGCQETRYKIYKKDIISVRDGSHEGVFASVQH